MRMEKFGLGQKDQAQLESGDLDFLVTVLTYFAKHWVEVSGYPAQAWFLTSFTNIAANNASATKGTTPEQRAFLAAGCDLLDLLALTPQGRKAISHFIGEPLSQEVEGE